MPDLRQSARDWMDRREKQAQDIADRLRSTARVNAPAIEQGAVQMLAPTAGLAILGAGTVIHEGLTPTQPTAEDKPQVTPPPPVTPTAPDPQATQTFAMPSQNMSSSRASTSVTEGVKLSPETRDLLDRSGQEQRSAIQQGGAAQAQENTLEADQAKRTAIFQGAQQIEQQLDPAKLHIQHQVDEETQKLRDLQNEKIDAKHFQKSQHLGERLTWALGMAFGGFAAGMRGGTNTAAQLYSQAIQDDIDAQRSNLAHKTDLQKGLLGDLQKRFADKQQQDAAAQITGLNIFKTKLAAEGADSKNQLVQSNVAREIAAADNLLAQQHAKFDEAASNRVTRNYETVSGEKTGAAGNASQQAALEARLVTLPDGRQVLAPSAEAANEYRERSSALQRYAQKVNRIAEIRKAHNGGTLMPSDRAEADALTAGMTDDYMLGVLGSKRAPSEQQVELSKKFIPTAQFGYGEDRKLAIAQQQASTLQDQMLKDFLNQPGAHVLGSGDGTMTPSGFVKQ